MEKTTLWNDGWSFLELPVEEKSYSFPESEAWASVDLPHDWMIYNTHALYRDSIGWYKKEFTLDEVKGLYAIRFDGVYMDTTVYVNGEIAFEWKYGYSEFEVDITDFVKEGKNLVAVRIVYRDLNTRWYSGAGIFRDVWFKTKNNLHIVSDGVYITEIKEDDNNWRVEVDTELSVKGEGIKTDKITLAQRLFDSDGQEVSGCVDFDLELKPTVSQVMNIKNPKLWDIAKGNLYLLRTELWQDGVLLEAEENKIGFRTFEFNTNKGFFINGRHIKLNGVCEHHDLGALGSAFNKSAMRRKLMILRDMGVNAIRTSHNMPAKGLMELCDELGFLVDSEAFDMWESQKTPYDYGRFFNEWYKKDVTSWIRRDRNHASLLMWSIGNEIYDLMKERGVEITRNLRDEVIRNDPKRHAPVTMGSNYMQWDGGQKCSNELEVQGYNYGEYLYNEHRAKFPHWIIYGSETSSMLSSRGIYHFPREKRILSDTDEHCSALGNTVTGWGTSSYDECITADRDAKYSLGHFIWSGFDYIGESTPYQTKNCYFGQIDTAGFPKDSFYIFKSLWDKDAEPFVHLYPYWDFNEGQLIDLQVATNAKKVELFVNGKSQGIKNIDLENDKFITRLWKVPYEKGVVKAVAYNENGEVIAVDEKHSFSDPVKIELKAYNDTVKADGRDLAFVEISAFDKDGYLVENARNRIHVEVEGAGRLIGLDNGDSTDFDSHKGKSRRLFGGKMLAIIGTKQTAGEIKLTATTPGLEPQTITIQALESEFIEGVACNEENTDQVLYSGGSRGKVITQGEEEIPVRKIELTCEGDRHMTKKEGSDEKPSVVVTAHIYPENATYDELQWKAITDTGIEVNFVKIKAEGNKAIVTAIGDGEFRLRCSSSNGSEIESVQSSYEFVAEGLGSAAFDAYTHNSTGLFNYRNDRAQEGVNHGINFMGSGDALGVAGFTDLEFGDYGSDEISVYVFANTDRPVSLQVWEGLPNEEGSECLFDGFYHKPPRWMTFQKETFKLSRRVKGLTSIYLATKDGYQLNAMEFTKLDKAYEKLTMSDRTLIYGDTFKIVEDKIENIGNNVGISFTDMDFGTDGAKKITVCGRSPLDVSTLQIRFKTDAGDSVQVVNFKGSDDYTEQTFDIEKLCGNGTVEFVFLPGSNFDFAWFKFSK